MLVTIGTTDITNYINETSYNVNDVEYGEEWWDGNYDRHFRPKGVKTEGTFTMAFFTETDYTNFITLINNNTQDGFTTATVFNGTRNLGVSGSFKFNRKMTKKVKALTGYALQLVEVEVKEK